MVSGRVHCRVAAPGWRHVAIRHRHLRARIRGTGAPVGAPARGSVSRNGRADVPFVAGLPIDRFQWHLPPHRQHRMLAAAGITVSRGLTGRWASRAVALLKPVHDGRWRPVPGMTCAGVPGAIPAATWPGKEGNSAGRWRPAGDLAGGGAGAAGRHVAPFRLQARVLVPAWPGFMGNARDSGRRRQVETGFHRSWKETSGRRPGSPTGWGPRTVPHGPSPPEPVPGTIPEDREPPVR